MTEKEIKSLMTKYLNGTITAQEEKLLEKYEASLILKNEQRVFKNESHAQQLGQKLFKKIHKNKTKKLRKPWLGIAASIAIVMGIGSLVYYGVAKHEQVSRPVAQITKTTEWGKRIDFTLSDGTEITLNSGSTITFPETFEGHKREVSLIGEAFFEVAKNVNKPFIIKSGDLQTTVLGTSFNINAYPNSDNIAVTVATGKVQIGTKSKIVFLNPNEQGVFYKNLNRISKKGVNTESVINWQKGILKFDDITIKESLVILERWYGVNFIYDDNQYLDCYISAVFDNESLSNVLESIAYVKKGLEFQPMKNNNILVNGKCLDKD